ncbi:MAG: GGDEF domain-containing protein [Candidatus Nanopelagicales bacterium]|nr:GGDEF domain-containing protein [Candidatus Nanopelagicales bacterium]
MNPAPSLVAPAGRGSRLAVANHYPRGWIIALVGCMALLVVIALMTPETLARSWVTRGAGVAACLVFVVVALRLPAKVRWFWLLMGAYLTITVAADVIDEFELLHVDPEGFPELPDFMYLATYAPAIIALAVLGRRISSSRNVDSWIDALIVTAAGTAMVGAWIIGPLLVDAATITSATVVSCIYPVLDILLLAALVRTLFASPRWNPALGLLAASLLLFLIADLYYNVLSAADEPANERLLEVLWTAAILSLPLAVTAPGAATITARSSSPSADVSLLRASILGVAVLVPPLLVMGQQWRGHYAIATRLSALVVVVIALLFWRAARLLARVRDQAHELESQARTDPLTGLPNRRTWEHELARVAERARASGRGLTVAMLDLDHFKRFNDTFGHLQGDDLLIEAAHIWSDLLEPDDVIARYGGEEFSVLLPGRTEEESFDLLQRLRASTPLHQTISIGFADLRPGEEPIEAVRRADIALYRAKTQGRNRVVGYEGPETFLTQHEDSREPTWAVVEEWPDDH